ncbi:MAG: pyridoxine 5'-phosphate synthase [Candidatus Margulisiibacteriota bacterium]
MSKKKCRLSVNIDHVATLRQARGEGLPCVVEAAQAAVQAGADGLVCHLREDRRHIQDADVFALRRLATRLDMEMAATDEMVKIACRVKPDLVTLVPEKRQELTTEGGLDVVALAPKLAPQIKKLQSAGIKVSLFVEPSIKVIKKSAKLGAEFVEIHTGRYANAKNGQSRKKELNIIIAACSSAHKMGLKVNAGHGLDYNNVYSIARIPAVEELNIGFSIIARAMFVGLTQAVREMIGMLSPSVSEKRSTYENCYRFRSRRV